MDIVIHGTKGGCKIFTPKKMSGLLDVTADSPKVAAIGQHAYAIRFTVDNAIFSKYKIIRDVRGDKRTGFVAFSLFLPNDKKLFGLDLIALLDRVSDEYCQKYIVENNLDEVTESWDFLNSISSEYEIKLKYSDNKMQSGSKDDAFVYYKETDELKRYFDVPFQEEYIDYRQVFFVKNDLQDKPENPLNALRHNPSSNLTGRIDLENPKYKLKNFYGYGNNGITIEIWANDRKCLNSGVINRKDHIRIRYSKNKYFTPVEESGKLTDSNISQYLFVDENKITVRNDVELPKVRQKITLEVRDRKGNIITDAEITCRSSFSNITKTVASNEIEFEGEELKVTWTISAIKDDLVARQPISFTHEVYSESILLILQEHKKVTFQVTDEDGLVFDYNIQIRDKQGIPLGSGKDFEFVGGNIDNTFDVTVLSNKHEHKFFTYCPAIDENPKPVQLKKIRLNSENKGGYKREEKKRYYLKIDEKHGKRSYKGESLGNYEHCYPQFNCDPKFGYKFDTWKKHDEYYHYNYQNYDGYFEAQFKELWYHKISNLVWILSVIAIVSTFAIIFLVESSSSENNNTKQLTDKVEIKRQIQIYVDGDTLLLGTLNRYRTAWEKHEPKIEEKDGILGLFLNLFGGGKQQPDSIEYNEWNEIMQSIDRATTKRDLINNANFAELKKKRYSNLQQKFKVTVGKIDSTKYKNIGTQLGDVSALSLNQIADSIASILNTPMGQSNTSTNGKQNQSNGRNAGNLQARQNSSLSSSTSNSTNSGIDSNSARNSSSGVNAISNSSSGNGTTTDISTELQSGNINPKKLSEFEEANFSKYSSSIKLYRRFFDLIKDANNQKDSYTNLLRDVNNDNVLKNSELFQFLNSICKDSKTFNESYKKIKDIPESDRNKHTLLELKEQIILK